MRSPLGALLNKAAGGPPVPFVSRGTRTVPFMRRRDAEQQMAAMGAVGTLFAIVQRTSTAVAEVEWKLWRTAKNGNPDERTEVTSHAALDLWNKPNPYMPRHEFVETFEQHLDLTGEGWWVIARDPRFSIPLELWPVRPDRMEPIPDPVEFLTGYLYLGPSGERVQLGRDEVVQLRTPNPLDPYRGMGPVQSMLADLDATRYSAEWNRNFFLNSAEPGGIVEVEKRLSDAEFDEFTARWGEQHKGTANAHRVGLLEGGMKWVDRKYTMRDMQFAELRNVGREVIREAFGMPKGMLGTVDDVNRANAEAGEVMFARYLVVPRLDRIKAALNHDLLPLFGPTARGLEFDYVNPVPADRELEAKELTSKAEAARNLIEAGGYGPEVLAAVGLPEFAFGRPDADPDKELLIKLVTAAPAALAGTILPLLGIEVPPPPAPAAPEPAPAPPAARNSLSVFDLARARAPHRPALRAQDQAEDDDGLDAARAALDDALDQLLDDWQDISADQRDALIEQVRAAVEDGDTEALSALTASSEAGAAALTAAMAALWGTAAGQVVAEASAHGATVEEPEAPEEQLGAVAGAVAALLAAGLAAAAGREALRLMVPGAVAAEVAEQVRAFLVALSDRPLRDALGGALHRALNGARLAVCALALEAVPGASLVAAERLDANRCAPCSAVDGRVFSGLAEAQAAYGTGGYRECLGGVRCRGTVAIRWDGAQ
ncbi:phage portal protein [Streptomyces sp. NRRL S-337]|uniref:phage portal protein n=1 Tax=Streptomyces sp. NRRL S-337 TaxID=1463900 RepID=UPI0004CA4461|nr:phage portal protein [Streptomyces sp. NRRL S-337]